MRNPWLLGILLAVLFVPAATAQAEPAAGDLNVSDGEGDALLRGTPTTTTPLTDSIDIVAFRVGEEDMEGLRVEVKVKALETAAPSFSSSRYVEFVLAQPSIQYELAWHDPGFGANATPDISASLCIRAGQDQRYGPCSYQTVEGGADYASDTLWAYLSKGSLMGRNPLGSYYGAAPLPEIQLGQGSRLEGFVAWTGNFYGSDRAPNSGEAGPYVLREPSANERLRLSLPKANQTEDPYDPYNPYDTSSSAAVREVAVDASEPNAIPLQVSNHNGGKRLVNLTTSFVDPKAGERWSARIAPSLSVPGNESRVVNLILTANAKVEHRERVDVRVLARSVGVKDELGAITLHVVATVPPSPKTPVLHLHAAQLSHGGALFEPLCVTPRVPLFCDADGWMNTLEQDPRATLDGGYDGSMGFNFQSGGAYYEFLLDSPLSRDLVFSPQDPIVVKIASTGAGQGVTVEVQLFTQDLHIGTGQGALSTSAEPVEISFLAALDAMRIPAGSPMMLTVEFTWPPASAAHASPPRLVPKSSSLSLPLIEDPNSTQAAPPLGDGFVTLRVNGDRQDFVNPGEARRFGLTLLNEASLEDTISLKAESANGACRAELRPGDEYRLEAGDSARLDVLVFAAGGAKEGTQCPIRLSATSSVDPSAAARLELSVIVTTGTDMEDDSENYTSSADAASKLANQPSGKGSPGVGALWLLAVTLVGVASKRRRSQV